MGSERLHPFSLIFLIGKAVLHFIRHATIPLIIGFSSGKGTGRMVLIVAAVAAVLLVATVVSALVRYLTFRFTLTDQELIIREGVLHKHERHIPFGRIQDVRLQQTVLQRVIGVAEVQLDTGGQGVEASLSVIHLRAAEALRARIFAQERIAVSPEDKEPVGDEGPVPEAVHTPHDVLKTLSVQELILAGLTRNWLAPIVPVLLGALTLLKDLPDKLQGRLAETAVTTTAQAASALTRQQLIGGGVVLVLGLILLGMIASVIRTVILFYGFQLVRTGEDLHRTYGLLTRHVIRLPRRRIQVVQIEEEWLRRRFGLATLRADTAGSLLKGGTQAEAGQGSNVILPLIRREAVEPLLQAILQDAEPAPAHYTPVSPLAIRREAMQGTWLCLLLSLGWVATSAGLRMSWWPGFFPLAGIPFFWWASRSGYRQMGYALGARLFRTRRGILSRSEHLVPLRNIQVVTLKQTPFDRWLGLATLQVDTAGQAFTGGGPLLNHVPQEEALALARTLAREAQYRRFEWQR